MADRGSEYYDYYLDPDVWPEFMRAGLLPVPPSAWPDAAATADYAPNADVRWAAVHHDASRAPASAGPGCAIVHVVGHVSDAAIGARSTRHVAGLRPRRRSTR
jgi:hypothetical protein